MASCNFICHFDESVHYRAPVFIYLRFSKGFFIGPCVRLPAKLSFGVSGDLGVLSCFLTTSLAAEPVLRELRLFVPDPEVLDDFLLRFDVVSCLRVSEDLSDL